MGFWEKVKKVIDEADVVFEVVDARFPEQSRNHALEEMVRRKRKEFAIILNKADLVGKKAAQKSMKMLEREVGNAMFISAKLRKGTARLREGVGKIANGRKVKIAICGYPNVGKSSIINALARRKSARTSSRAGFTKGLQYLKVNKSVMLIDTPGVIPINEKDETLMLMLGSKNPEQAKDLESAGLDIGEILMRNIPEALNSHYGTDAKDAEELLEKIALSRNMLSKGGKPNLNAAARILISDFQQGKIREIGVEKKSGPEQRQHLPGA